MAFIVHTNQQKHLTCQNEVLLQLGQYNYCNKLRMTLKIFLKLIILLFKVSRDQEGC